jgi:hypothetical protein
MMRARPTRIIDEPRWRELQREHLRRVSHWTVPHRERARRRESHPVLDFMFTYYSHRPALLERWHPGSGVVLGGAAEEFLRRPGYRRTADGVSLDPAELPGPRVQNAEFVLRLLRAISGRAPRLTCFGMHEWAMVYRTGAPRHAALPLRLGAAGTDAVVEAQPLRCTHHDAFRFFTSAARPLNATAPARAEQLDNEQPGCLHATMDLYKWAYKLSPATPSELVADCFELAVDVRALDMRASPYDLSALGYPAVRVETAEGRAVYARAQATFAERAQPLRKRLIKVAERIVSSSDRVGTPSR